VPTPPRGAGTFGHCASRYLRSLCFPVPSVTHSIAVPSVTTKHFSVDLSERRPSRKTFLKPLRFLRLGFKFAARMIKNNEARQRKYRIHFSAYGGQYRNTRKGRSRPRPISSRYSMHLVLRSTSARGNWSFWRSHNSRRIEAILTKFSKSHGVRIISKANVGNHLHLHIRLFRISGYKRFIRAVTGSIAMAVTGKSRWSNSTGGKQKFWDLRPFTRIVIGTRDFSNVKNYIRINQLEGLGYPRTAARAMAYVEQMLNTE
jgi:hypothetical protein